MMLLLMMVTTMMMMTCGIVLWAACVHSGEATAMLVCVLTRLYECSFSGIRRHDWTTEGSTMATEV